MSICKKCNTHSPVFQVQLDRIVNVKVDEKGNIIEELNVENQKIRYGSVFTCTICGKEYVKLEPLLAHEF